ncbi:hypothetical protein [Kerstersia similis]|uniref:hypothetical protein n=1 Tax=Kerstersia similis TaxID=206505 RepID=UPI0039EF5C98
MDAQFGQGYGLVLGTVLLAVVAFWVALLMRRAGARQDTDDSGSADHGSESTDADAGSVEEVQAESRRQPDDLQAQRLEQARKKFEQQLSAIDLDLDAPPAPDRRPAAERHGPRGGSR